MGRGGREGTECHQDSVRGGELRLGYQKEETSLGDRQLLQE